MPEYHWKQTGPEVEKLQKALLKKGFKLPKYGADGFLGKETWAKIEAYARVDQFSIKQALPVSVTDEILDETKLPEPTTVIREEKSKEFIYPSGYVRVQGDPNDNHGSRSWKQINTIMIHHTGVWMTDTPDRFDTVNAHVGILKEHKTPIVQIHELTTYCYHGNRTNRYSIGIEINGHFPGLVKKYKSSVHSSEGPTERQVTSTKDAIMWIVDEVAANGGEIKHIIPHRVASDSRASDPGELTWKAIGLWAQDELGLTDMGPGWTIGDGNPIPCEWDDRPAYSKYHYYS